MEKLQYQKDKQQFIFTEKMKSGKYVIADESQATTANIALPNRMAKKKKIQQSQIPSATSSIELSLKDTDIFHRNLSCEKYTISDENLATLMNTPLQNHRPNKNKNLQGQLSFATSPNEPTIKEGQQFTINNAFSRQKKQQLIKKFTQKLKRSIVRTIDEKQSEKLALNMANFEQTQNISEQQQQIFQHNMLNNGFFLLKSFLIICLFLLTTIYISFEDANVLYGYLTGLKGGIIILIFVEITKRVIDICKQKSQHRLKLIKKQLQKKKKNVFMLLIMVISIVLQKQVAVQILLILMYFLELSNMFDKMKLIENYVLYNSGFEGYWDLCKILLVNFFIAHCLSIILNAMVNLQVQGNSWYDLKSLDEKPWFQKYIWGYYWGTTIMLSVGFGDIAANNYIQALCLVFIEIVSCIILAYNISEVSKIIQNMRQLDKQKNHKLKVFHTIAKKYQISEQLSDTVKNHIQQSIQMKKDFNIAQEQKIIDQLPQKLQNQVKKQINKSIFYGAFFLGDLTLKCQQKLAQKIYKTVTHPDQLILRKGQPWKVLILRTGIVGLAYRRDKSNLNGMIIDKTKIINQKDKKLISTSFIWGGHAQGDLKSLTVSVLATIQKQKLEEILKKHNAYMFEYYCCERDRFQNRMQNRTQKCQVCKQGNHSKIYCPSMHYLPLQQILIGKYLKSLGKQGLRVDKQNRAEYYRRKNITDMYLPLKNCQAMLLTQETIGQSLNSISSSKKNIPNKISLHRLKTIVSSSRNSVNGGRNSVFGNLNFQDRKNTNSIDINVITAQISRKVQKLQFSVEQILNITKNNHEQIAQLETDKPWNYKSYFIKYNPQNLSSIYAGAKLQRVNKLLNQTKNTMKSSKASFRI